MSGASETCLSPQQVAKLLGLSADAVRIQFRRLPGVILVGDGARKRLRIPESVLKTWMERHKVKGAG